MIQIADNLKALRKQKGLTQEELAGFIGVSFQAISKWERDEGYPDITTLPALANFFGLTIDELLGINTLKDNPCDRVFNRVHEYIANEDYAEAVKLLRETVKGFPNDDGLWSELALALALSYEAHSRLEDATEAVMLAERVLTYSQSEKIKGTTRAGLCLLLNLMGSHEKAFELSKTLPHDREGRESIQAALKGDNNLTLRTIVLGE